MYCLREGWWWFLKRQNGTKEQLFLILGAKGVQHGLYLYLSLRMNGQSMLSFSLAAPRAMQQICITPRQATQKCKIIVNRVLMKTKGVFRVFLRSVSSPHMTSFPFLNFRIERSLVLTAFGLDFLNPAQDVLSSPIQVHWISSGFQPWGHRLSIHSRAMIHLLRGNLCITKLYTIKLWFHIHSTTELPPFSSKIFVLSFNLAHSLLICI